MQSDPYATQAYPQPPYQYVYVVAPPPPPPPRKRRRALWIVLTYVVVFAVLAAGAWFVPPLIWPAANLTAITHPGPMSVEGLTELLAAPPGARVERTDELTIDAVAELVDPEHPADQVKALRANGFRWAAGMTWTGDDGQSSGRLRLIQFRTVSGATRVYGRLLGSERLHPTAEETSLVEVAGAALFTDENREDGEIIRATFGRSVIVGHIEVTEAARHVRNDVPALVMDVTNQLPEGDWTWDEPAVTPVDLAPLLLPAPPGAREVDTPEEFRMRAMSEAYLDPNEGEEYLASYGFQRGLATGWTESDNVRLSLTLLLFKAKRAAEDFTVDARTEIERLHPQAAPAEGLPGLMQGRLHVYPYEGWQIGVATFYRGNIFVELYLYGPRAVDREHLIALALQQFDRLPDPTG